MHCGSLNPSHLLVTDNGYLVLRDKWPLVGWLTVLEAVPNEFTVVLEAVPNGFTVKWFETKSHCSCLMMVRLIKCTIKWLFTICCLAYCVLSCHTYTFYMGICTQIGKVLSCVYLIFYIYAFCLLFFLSNVSPYRCWANLPWNVCFILYIIYYISNKPLTIHFKKLSSNNVLFINLFLSNLYVFEEKNKMLKKKL